MKFTKNWLQELINIDLTTEKLAEQLTMVGLEVDSIKPVAGDFHGVVVGEVLEVTSHPNADKLSVCQVSVGAAEPLNIVCGAKNVRAKLKVPVALVGAELPNNFKIKNSKLRGVDSAGMLCSAVELGLPDAFQGILELPDDAPIGVDIRKYLKLDDAVIEIELTANRGDCLSMTGIAREVAAINRIKPTQLETPEFKTNEDIFPVTIEAKDACSHYCGRIIRGVNNHVNTPLWMQERLRRLGHNPISFVVDVTNYVMLELGQPLHAFDLSKLDKKIDVRYAKQGEEIVLLDGNKVELNTKTLVIADNSKCLAIAGVMGGTDTGVSLDTRDIFLESAFFIPEKIAGIARSYNLQTDSSYRFERGVDYKLQLQALDRATALILEIAGGNPGIVSEAIVEEYLPKSSDIILRRSSIEKILGISITDKDITDILLYLGMKLEPTVDGWKVVVPSWRFDIKIEEDLVEEVARIYGYHLIPEQKIIADLGGNNAISDRRSIDRIYDLMEDRGYNEVITYSFIDEKLQALFGADSVALPLANPISSEQSVMRTTLWPGLINAVKHNFQRQQQRARFFEVGLRFLQQDNSLEQQLTIAGVISGDLYPEQWGIKQKENADFFDLKNDVVAILKLFAYESDVEFIPKSHSALHPLRSAQICVAGFCVGFIGELHPMIKQQLELNKFHVLFEINLSSLINKMSGSLKTISRFPKIQRDIAIIVNKDISWTKIRQKIVDISGDLLHNVAVFDVYYSENIGLDKRSMAIHLDFQSISRTLVDTEVDLLIDNIVLVLKQSFGASLRG